MVPSQRPTIQSAIDDPVCTEVLVAAGTYSELIVISRSISITGASGPPSIVGNIVVRGSGVVVDLDHFQIQPFFTPLLVSLCSAISVVQNATLIPDRITVLDVPTSGTCLIFADGFESGNTGRWSATAP